MASDQPGAGLDYLEDTTWRPDEARAHISERIHEVPWSGCWLWGQHIDRNGYGHVTIPKNKALKTTTRRLTHRAAYEAWVGSAAGMHVLHSCDVPACCNPAHLRLGTVADNMADKIARGRANRAGNPGGRRVNPEMVLEVRKRAAAGESYSSIARDMPISYQQVSNIVRGLAWKDVI